MKNYEQTRLEALKQLDLLDTPPSESFDRITRLAVRLFNLPMAAVSLTDEHRLWFKSRVGVDHWEMPRYKACCGEVADTADILVIDDLLASPYYHDSLLARSGIRFYAGAPLLTRDGFALGAMCVLGHQPRSFSDQEIIMLQDLAAMVMAQIELEHAFGRIEPVTSLPNFSQFAEDVAEMIHEQPATFYALNTEIIDFSQASSLQQVMGPSYLDELSREASRCIRQVIGRQTRLYHIGPCQFVHIVPPGELANVEVTASRLREQLLTLTLGGSSPFMLRPAVGIAPFMLGDVSAGDIVRRAHCASRDARQAGLGVGMYSPALDETHRRRFNLLAEFRSAVSAPDQLYLVYQPRLNTHSGLCVGAEALIRWRHPILGEVSPAEFIPLVEKTPLSRSLTEWVMAAAIQQTAIWYRQGFRLRVSINIASVNLDEEDFTERLLSYLKEADLPASAIELELTEGGLISNGRAAQDQLKRLVEEGICIAIDDFGTGYSSLAYLQQMPAHIVKIDRSFIGGLATKERHLTLVRAMIAMAHDLGYGVVAEGVENLESFHLLRNLNCDEVQGFYFAKPLPAADLERWLSQPVQRRSASR